MARMKIDGHEFIGCPRAGSVGWQRRWGTQVAQAARGAEEREAMRTVGLKAIEFTCQPISLEERALLDAAILEGVETGKVCAPFWGRGVALAADCSATTVTVENNDWGFGANDYVFLIDQELRALGDVNAWEVRQISGVAGSVLTLSGGAVARTYKNGSLVWPLIFGKLEMQGEAENTHRTRPRLRIIETDPNLTQQESACPALTSYLGRPIAPIVLDWTQAARRSLSFELREIELGFGASEFGPLQNHASTGWEFSTRLEGSTAIKAWDCFTAGRNGGGGGFWLRDAVQMFVISSVPGAGVVRAVDSGLAEAWDDEASAHVIFMLPDLSVGQTAQIASVTDLGGGIEEITFTTGVLINPAWTAFRLRYVRLAGDVESGEFSVEQRQQRRVRVIELPEEYLAAETAAATIYLYTFWIETPGGNQYWRLTGNYKAVTSVGNVFKAKRIEHGEIKRGSGASPEEVTIEAGRDTENPLSFFVPFKMPLDLWVEIKETTDADPDVTTSLFLGIVQRAPCEGKVIRARAVSFLDAEGMMAPSFLIGAQCNHKWAGVWCALNKATYAIAVTMSTISADGRTIRVTAAALNANNVNGAAINAADYFSDGWLETGAALTFQIAAVLKSTVVNATTQDLELAWPLQFAAAGQNATIYPGCDRRHATCLAKFNNVVNFGGHPRVPQRNPSIQRPNTIINASKKG